MNRCSWGDSHPLYLDYHDREWGVPVRDDLRLFEMLVLEGMQAGLSWLTILKKRDHFRLAFDYFDPLRIAGYDADKIAQLLANPGIIRNRLKVQAAVDNARCFLQVQHEFGRFSDYIWQFVRSQPRQNHWTELKQIPARTPESDLMSQDLKKRGFRFVGSTICYAFMQAVGLVNDHLVDCFRHPEINQLSVMVVVPGAKSD